MGACASAPAEVAAARTTQANAVAVDAAAAAATSSPAAAALPHEQLCYNATLFGATTGAGRTTLFRQLRRVCDGAFTAPAEREPYARVMARNVLAAAKLLAVQRAALEPYAYAAQPVGHPVPLAAACAEGMTCAWCVTRGLVYSKPTVAAGVTSGPNSGASPLGTDSLPLTIWQRFPTPARPLPPLFTATLRALPDDEHSLDAAVSSDAHAAVLRHATEPLLPVLLQYVTPIHGVCAIVARLMGAPTHDLAYMCQALWADELTQYAVAHRRQFGLPLYATYGFDRLRDMGDALLRGGHAFVPTPHDCVMACVATTQPDTRTCRVPSQYQPPPPPQEPAAVDGDGGGNGDDPAGAAAGSATPGAAQPARRRSSVTRSPATAAAGVGRGSSGGGLARRLSASLQAARVAKPWYRHREFRPPGAGGDFEPGLRVTDVTGHRSRRRQMGALLETGDAPVQVVDVSDAALLEPDSAQRLQRELHMWNALVPLPLCRHVHAFVVLTQADALHRKLRDGYATPRHAAAALKRVFESYDGDGTGDSVVDFVAQLFTANAQRHGTRTAARVRVPATVKPGDALPPGAADDGDDDAGAGKPHAFVYVVDATEPAQVWAVFRHVLDQCVARGLPRSWRPYDTPVPAAAAGRGGSAGASKSAETDQTAAVSQKSAPKQVSREG